jgi:cation diffusion facilitator CzcD-associated flavoprotein CzcO
MEAIQKDNVDVHFTAVEKITEDGVIGGDGEERKVDTIICATGFDVTYKPRFPIIGKNGVGEVEERAGVVSWPRLPRHAELDHVCRTNMVSQPLEVLPDQ